MLVFVLGTMSFVSAASVSPILHEGNFKDPTDLLANEYMVRIEDFTNGSDSVNITVSPTQKYTINYTIYHNPVRGYQYWFGCQK
jgi:hypothetical protein